MIDKITREGIEKLSTAEINVVYFESIDSTNRLLKEMAKNGVPHGTVVVSGMQTGGRGRLGRSFFSPENSGIYMSMLLRPKESLVDVSLITAYTAVAVCKSLEKFTREPLGIKWVNDIIYRDKKVCGILAESCMDGNEPYVIVGVGINVYAPKSGFPKDISNIAGAVFDRELPNLRNEIIAGVSDFFFGKSPIPRFIEEYISRSTVVGKEVNVIKPSETKSAIATGIDENCNLHVEYENGEKEILSFGEISVKPKKV